MSTKKNSRYFSPERMSRLTASILLSFAISVMILIVAPFEIFCNNLSELNFSVSDFLPVQILLALGLSVLIFSALFFTPRIVYEYAYPTLLGILFMFFLQSNYLNVGLTSLAGDQIGGGAKISTYVWNTAVWVLVIAGMIVAYRLIKQRSTVRLVALIVTIAVFATQMMNFAVSSLSTEGAYDSAIDRVYGNYAENPRFLTNKGLDTVGSEKNVIVICVDRFDTLLYAEPAMQKYPETFAALDGFTFYRDAVSLYGYTFPSIAYMMSAIEYDHSGDRRAFFDRVYNQNQTISRLHDLGYSVHLFSESYYDYSNANELPEYVENAIETDRDSLETTKRFPERFALAISKMALYRVFPFILKPIVGGVSSDTCNEYILYTSRDLSGYHAYSYDMKDVYNDIQDLGGVFQTKGEKNFTFLHISGCHNAKYDENWNKSGHKKDVLVSAKNSIDLITLYLDGIKSISETLYRDSTIVIMGDHGKVLDPIKDLPAPMMTAIFVKPSGESGSPLRISDAPVAHENVWATIFESEGIEYDSDFFARSIFDIEREFEATGAYPERRFIWTQRKVGQTDYHTAEYVINGPARDLANWSIVARNHYENTLFH